MDLPSTAIIEVLTYLLPGFITSAVVHGLTPAPRPIPFERVIQALIFTLVIQAAVTSTKFLLLLIGSKVTLGPWTSEVALCWSVVFAAAFGLVVAWMANSDKLHHVLRRLRITHQTSFSSEWYGQLCKHEGYVVLHLAGERRLLGWAEEWPSTPGTGHFALAHAQWLDDSGECVDLTTVRRILVRAEDVELVELMEMQLEETKHGRKKSPNAASAPAEGGTAD